MQPLLQQFTQFVINHWILWSVFAVVLIAVIFEEIKGKLNAAPSLTPHELSMLLNHEEAIVIDIRATTVFVKGHILSSQNIPLPTNKNLDEIIKRLTPKKEQHIVLVDSMGADAGQIALKLYETGFTKVSILNSGMNAWKQAGMPVTNK